MERFRETLTPSLPFHLALLVVIPLGFGMLAPINITWGVAAGATFYLATLAIFVAGAPRIVVTDDTLRAGRAHIDRVFVGKVTVVPRDNRSDALSDARTWKLLRAWIPTGVLVSIDDPDDPTPSWYVTTRRPDELRAALTD